MIYLVNGGHWLPVLSQHAQWYFCVRFFYQSKLKKCGSIRVEKSKCFFFKVPSLALTTACYYETYKCFPTSYHFIQQIPETQKKGKDKFHCCWIYTWRKIKIFTVAVTRTTKMTFFLNKVEKKSTKNLISFDSEWVGSVIRATHHVAKRFSLKKKMVLGSWKIHKVDKRLLIWRLLYPSIHFSSLQRLLRQAWRFTFLLLQLLRKLINVRIAWLPLQTLLLLTP